MRQDVLDTWKSWDENPGAEQKARARIKSINDFAESKNLDALDLRRKMMTHRRSGKSYEQCLLLAEEECRQCT